MAGFLQGIFGAPAKVDQIQHYNPQQQQAFSQILQQALQGIQRQPQFDFAPIANQAREQFNQQTIPTIAERFTSMGDGAQNSSGFQQALGSAGSDLETNLASLGAQYGLQGQQMNQANNMNLLGLGLTPQYGSQYIDAEPGFLINAVRGLGGLLGIGGTNNTATGVAGGGLQALLSLLGIGGNQQQGGLANQSSQTYSTPANRSPSMGNPNINRGVMNGMQFLR